MYAAALTRARVFTGDFAVYRALDLSDASAVRRTAVLESADGDDDEVLEHIAASFKLARRRSPLLYLEACTCHCWHGGVNSFKDERLVQCRLMGTRVN